MALTKQELALIIKRDIEQAESAEKCNEVATALLTFHHSGHIDENQFEILEKLLVEKWNDVTFRKKQSSVECAAGDGAGNVSVKKIKCCYRSISVCRKTPYLTECRKATAIAKNKK